MAIIGIKSFQAKFCAQNQKATRAPCEDDSKATGATRTVAAITTHRLNLQNHEE